MRKEQKQEFLHFRLRSFKFPGKDSKLSGNRYGRKAHSVFPVPNVIAVLRSSVFFPALECGKVFAHQRDGLLESIAFAIFVAELFVELCTVADHLLHRTCRGEGAALVTIDAVFPARASVGFSAEIARRLHRHAAALAEFHLFVHRSKVLYPAGTDEARFVEDLFSLCRKYPFYKCRQFPFPANLFAGYIRGHG